jgi:hypothetical protein
LNIGSISVPAGLHIESMGEQEVETLLLQAVMTADPRP